jgi:hypothetical protein
MPLQVTEHWRSYIKTTCDIGLPVMLFIQVVHKDGSSSQVPVSDAHQGEVELQAKDDPATEPQEEGDGGSGKEEEGHGHTHFEGAIDEGEVHKELLRQFEMEANGDERGLEEDSSHDAGLSRMGQLRSPLLSLLTSMGKQKSMTSVLHHFIYDLLM